MIHKTGYKTQFSQVYSADDPHLESDAQFGVTRELIAHYVAHDNERESAPASDVRGRWYTLQRTFVIERGPALLPKPPITGKASERPELTVLQQRPPAQP
jgi:catechol 1,2-dioxygenase